MDYIGYSFQPGQDKRMTGALNQGRLSPTASDALRVLSLRLPTVLGGTPVAPMDLLKPSVGGTPTGSAVAETLARITGGAAATPTPPPLSTAGPVASPITTTNYAPSPSIPIRPVSSPASAPAAAPPSAPATRPSFGGVGRPRDTGGAVGGGFNVNGSLNNLGMLMNQMLNNPNFTVHNGVGGGFGPFDGFGNVMGVDGAGGGFGGPQLA